MLRAILGGFLFVEIFVSNAFGTATLDQSHEVMQFVSQGGVGGSKMVNSAQTVRVGISGQLTRIDFWAYATFAGIGDLIVDVRPVDADGSPTEDDLSAFASVTIPRANIIADGNLGPDPIKVDPLLVTVDLTPLDLHMVAGQQFAVNFSATSSPDEVVAFGILGHYGVAGPNGPYDAGSAYLRVSDLSDREFVAWTFNDQGPRSVDLGFRTYVVPVPEPSAFGMVGSIFVLGATLNSRRTRVKFGGSSRRHTLS